MPPQIDVSALLAELRALESKVQIVAQRMNMIERNEQIIGRTLISHNKMLKELEAAVSGKPIDGLESVPPAVGAETEVLQRAVSELENNVSKLRQKADASSKELENLKQLIDEVKFLFDALNPAELVTVKQLKELLADLPPRERPQLELPPRARPQRERQELKGGRKVRR
ncbi:hypothetical protein HY546_03730 [archaeon]|nr:hypothetical protein [archaeon]